MCIGTTFQGNRGDVDLNFEGALLAFPPFGVARLGFCVLIANDEV